MPPYRYGSRSAPRSCSDTAAIGRDAGVPVESVSPETASDRYGFVGRFVGVDNPTSSVRTQELLGWTPSRPGLLEDLSDLLLFRPLVTAVSAAAASSGAALTDGGPQDCAEGPTRAARNFRTEARSCPDRRPRECLIHLSLRGAEAD